MFGPMAFSLDFPAECAKVHSIKLNSFAVKTFYTTCLLDLYVIQRAMLPH